MSTFIRPRRAHFRFASGVIVRDLFAPTKLARCLLDPNLLAPSNFSNITVCANSVARSLTGSVVETIIGTVNFPALGMGLNGAVRIKARWSCTNNANVKTGRILLNNAGPVCALALANQNGGNLDLAIFNRNATNSQIAAGAMIFDAPNTVTPIVSNFAIETNGGQNALTFTGILTNAGDIITLEYYLVEIIRF